MKINVDQIHLSRWKRLRFDVKRGSGHMWPYLKNRFIWHTYPRIHRVSRFPDHVDVEISSACNMRCPMCYTRTEEFKKLVKRQFMSFELFKKIINECAKYHAYSIRLSLRGEPFIHKDVIKMIRYAKRKGIKEISTLSNILALTPELFKEAMDAGLDWLTISFDGIGKTYEKIRKPAKFEEAYKKIKAYKRIKNEAGSVKPVIKIQSVWPAIKDTAEEYIRLFAPYVDNMAANPLVDYLHADKNIIYEKNFDCPVLYQRLVIGSDGKVLLCSNDEMCYHSVGDANKQSIYEIWHGAKMQEAREIHRQHEGVQKLKPCKYCYLPRKTVPVVERIGKKKIVVCKLEGRTEEIGK